MSALIDKPLSTTSNDIEEVMQLQVKIHDSRGHMFLTQPNTGVFLLPIDATISQMLKHIIPEVQLPETLMKLCKKEVWEDTPLENASRTKLTDIGCIVGKTNLFMLSLKSPQRSEELNLSTNSTATAAAPSAASAGPSTDDVSVPNTYTSSGSYNSPTTTTTTETAVVSCATSVGTTSSYNWNYSSYYDDKRSPTGFCGLANQGATCYMNSLLQSLYMTPEFRRAVYEWNFDEKFARDLAHRQSANATTPIPTPTLTPPNNQTTTEQKQPVEQETPEKYRERKERNSIPLQLQRLFAQLQLFSGRALSTKRLTKSFGWTDSESFTQHDVQELCRVLFDSLEQAMAGTHQAQLINELFQGRLRDYVRCLECKTERARQDTFLDVPLVIKGFGETKSITSVQEALRKFVTPEKLEGDNKYRCEHCAKLCDASKGLRFVSFPYILMLQLKRFDFDYTSMKRIKLNDRVEFPYVLDLNDFIEGGANDPMADTNSEQQKVQKAEDLPTIPLPEINPNQTQTQESASNLKQQQQQQQQPEKPEQMEIEQKQEIESKLKEKQPEQMETGKDDSDIPTLIPAPTTMTTTTTTTTASKEPVATKERPYVYELYAILMHRGNAMGGHYFAYIRDFSKNQWFEFNDSSVSEITDADIKRAFGDDPQTTYSSSSSSSSSYFSYSYGSSAYMLMYRRMDPTRNLQTIREEDIPKHLRDYVAIEEVEKKQKEEKKRIERETLTIRFFRGRDANSTTPKEKALHKSTTIGKALEAALELYGLKEAIPMSCARLRMYSETNNTILEPLENLEQRLENTCLSSFRSALYLETRQPDSDFTQYKPNDIEIVCSMYRSSSNTESKFEVKIITLDKYSTVQQMREIIAKQFSFEGEPKKLRLFHMKLSYYDPIPYSVLREETKSIFSCNIGEGSRIFAEECEDGTAELAPDAKTPSIDEIQRLKNVLSLHVIYIPPPSQQQASQQIQQPQQQKREENLSVDKRKTLLEFKTQLSALFGIPVDMMQVSRGTITWKYEFKELDQTLEEHRLYDGMDVFVDFGRPTRAGEYTVSLYLFELSPAPPHYTKLIDLPMVEDSSVDTVCEQISTALASLPGKDSIIIPPAQIRLRDMTSIASYPGKVIRHGTAIKDNLYIYTNKPFAIEHFTRGLEEEPVKTKDHTILYVQRWFTSKLELGTIEEIVVSQNEPFNRIRDLLAAKLGQQIDPKRVSLAKPYYGGLEPPNSVEISELKWDVVPFNEGIETTIFRAPIYLRDGDLVLYKDTEEKEKELTTQERQKIQKEAESKRAEKYSYVPRKEAALKIHNDSDS